MPKEQATGNPLAGPKFVAQKGPGAVMSHMTAARTGSTFDMADLITAGHAFKVPKKLLPSTDQKMKILGQTENTMPGDLMGLTAINPAMSRIKKVIVDRNLDLLNLMDDFIKRPRGSKMPVRNRAFMNVSDFRRALCYAMGDQWTGLAMSTKEFEDLYAPYVRKDAADHQFRYGDPTAPGGQPEPLIMWQQFARDVQRMADGSGLNEMQQALFDAEQELADRSNKAARAAEAMRDADATWGDAKARMEARQAQAEAAEKIPFGKRGSTLGKVEKAKKVNYNSLCGPGGKYDTVREALKDLDATSDGTLERDEIKCSPRHATRRACKCSPRRPLPTGTLERDEIKLYLRENYILQYVDFYTGITRGVIDEATVDTLMDIVDANNDGRVNYEEFAKVVMAGANTYYDMEVAQRGVAII